MKSRHCGIACFVLIAIGTAVAQPATVADSELRDLLDQIWQFELTESPLLATSVGDPRGQDRLGDVSLNAIDRRNSTRKEFLAELETIDPSRLSETAKIDHELARFRLQGQLANHRFRTHLMPISNRGGFHISFPELARRMNPKTESDFRNYTARLKDFGRYTDQQIDLLRHGIEQGLTQPSVIMREALAQVDPQIVDDPADSLLLTNIKPETRTALGAQVWSSMESDIIRAVDSTVTPAYRRFRDFLSDEYLPDCRGQVGASSLPDGRQFYMDRVKRFTTIEITPQELHDVGVKENARIRQEMEAIRESVGFEGDLDAFLEHLRTDPKFYAKSADELMKEVAYVLKKADGRLPELFGRLPRIPYGIREIPAYVAPQTTTAYYWPPKTDGTTAGFYYVNTYNLASRPLYQVESLSLHEAVPGHHLQLAIQAELTQLHPISRESNFTAFIEGWGLYAERLGKEIGFYQDPYQDFGRLSMEAWRASRLVVDTGIHWMGWSRGRAISYMKENTALSEHNIVAEVDRYIGWPGQALAYKTGQLAISRIRADAERRLGDRFDVRAFHDRVLEAGSIPLPMLERRVNQWVDQQLKDSPAVESTAR